MSKTSNLAVALFASRRAFPNNFIIGGSDIKVNSTGPKGVSNSSHSTSEHSAKMSHVFSSLIDIFAGTEPVAGLLLLPQKDTYVELNSEAYVIDNDTVAGTEDPTTGNILHLVTAYMLSQSDLIFLEFQEIYKKITDKLKLSGLCSFEDALLYCDSFYYTAKKIFPNSNTGPFLNIGENLTNESLSELGRFINPPLQIDFNTEVPPVEVKRLKVTTEEKISEPVGPYGRKTILERCKSGEFIIPYEWSDEEKDLIPDMSFLDLYIPSEEFEDCLLTMKRAADKILTNIDIGLEGADAIGNYGKGYAFIGKPGTGKSTMAKALCAAFQMPFYPCTTTRYSEEDEYQGKTKLTHEKEGAAGQFQFCETSFLKGFEHGGLVVLEEFNIADAGMLMGAIGQAIEKPFILEKDGYEPIVRHPLCFITFTCNVGTQGSQMPSEALFSRTPNVFSIDDPSDDDFVQILKNQTEDVHETDIRSVYTTYKRMLSYFDQNNMPELSKVLTLRHCLAALDQIASNVPIKRAINSCLINPLKVYAPDEAKELFESIIEPMKL